MDECVAQELDQVGEGIDPRQHLEPAWHEVQGVDRVAGEEEWHREHLADTHEPFARLEERREQHGQRREHGRADDDGDRTGQDRPQVHLEVHAEQEGDEDDDEALDQRTQPSTQSLSGHEARSRHREHQNLLQDARIPFPDNGEAVENRGEHDRLRQDARCHEGEIVLLPADQPGTRHRLTEDRQPENRLDDTRDDLPRIMAQLARLDLSDDERGTEKTRHLFPQRGRTNRFGDPCCQISGNVGDADGAV